MNRACFRLSLVFFACFFAHIAASSVVELRIAGFYPASSTFREVYEDFGANYQIEASTQLKNNYDFWVNFSWYAKYKKHEISESRIQIPTGSFGLKYIFANNFFDDNTETYVGAGLALTNVFLREKGCCINSKNWNFSAGVVVKSGVSYSWNENVVVDLFLDYIYLPVEFHKKVNVGGLQVGFGLGWRI